MKHIIIAPDSFKGSLSASQTATTIQQAIAQALPQCKTTLFPLADGGEGTLQILNRLLQGSLHSVPVHDALFRNSSAHYSRVAPSTAIIELAESSGMAQLTQKELNPMLATTFGMGEVIKSAITRGCRHLICAIGGSASTDGGTGLLQALGYRFLDQNKKELYGCGKNLIKIHSIDTTQVLPELKLCNFTLLCDVTNPLYGPHGAASVFAPQKGATPPMVHQLDEGLQHWNELIRTYCHKEIAKIPGAGAAGGAGSAFMAFLKADYQSGIQFILQSDAFQSSLSSADLIITGEGTIDNQSLHGKVLSGLLNEATPRHIPIVAFTGKCDLKATKELTLLNINPHNMNLQQAMQPKQARQNLYNSVLSFFNSITL